MNTTFSQLDRLNTIHLNDNAVSILRNMCIDKQLYDVWRKRNPESNVYSWKRLINGILKMSRIDYFLVSKSLSSAIRNIYYKHTTLSDHNFVFMNINLTKAERGPGVWVLNNQFLRDDMYTSKIENLVNHELAEPLYLSDILVWWDNLKYKIRKLSQLHGKNRNKKLNEKYNRIQRQLNTYTDMLSKGKNFDIEKYESLKQDLAEIENEKCQAAILRSKAFWAVDSDKNTSYFLNLEKYKQNMNCVTELIKDNGEIVTDTTSILDEEYNFYNDLYNCVEVQQNDLNEFTSSITPDVSEDDRNMCDEDISLDEIHLSLTSMTKNKSPGSDGLTVEFYIYFWQILKDILLHLYKTIEQEQIMSRTMRHGLISLIYKKGDRRELKNWRPISLLNVDYKILARVMANRLKYVLPNIISPNQTSSVLRRDISENICGIRDVIDMVEDNSSSGYIINIDQMKAFDRVSHKYLFTILEKFGFGQKFIKWIKIFYTDIFSAIKCNGFITNYFSVTNSVRQGCPISAQLFVICAEPLTRAIIADTTINSVMIPNSNHRSLIFQHADDTTCTVENLQSIETIFDIFEKYGRASGAKINRNKTELMTLGNATINQCDLTRLGVRKCDRSIKILGVYLGKDKKLCENQNWEGKMSKIKAVLNMWKQRKLNINGRATVVSTLLLSRLWYLAMVQPIPNWVESEMKKISLQFVWGKKSYPVKYDTIIGPKDKGGLNFPDIGTKVRAFRMKFLVRFIDNEHTAVWKHTMRYFLESVIGYRLSSDMHCMFLKLPSSIIMKLPGVYGELFSALNSFHDIIECDLSLNDILNQHIFFNKNICYKGKPLSFENFKQAGLINVKDLTYEVIPGFLPVQAIKELIWETSPEVPSNMIEQSYILIKTSIPFSWFLKINREFCVNQTSQPDFVLIRNSRTYLFSQCKTSIFYKRLIDEKFKLPTAITFWSTVFPSSDILRFGKLIHMSGKCPDMTDVDFKIFHNIVYTNEKLFKYGYSDSKMCSFCNKQEDIMHIFLHCERLTDFKKFVQYHIENLFRKLPNELVNKLDFNIILLFGFLQKPKYVNYILLNILVSHARLCIYKSRNIFNITNKIINVQNLFKYSFEKYTKYIYYYYKERRLMNTFDTFFLKNNNLIKLKNEQLSFHW